MSVFHDNYSLSSSKIIIALVCGEFWVLVLSCELYPSLFRRYIAIKKAIKAIAIARGYVAPTGKDLICVPAFSDIVIDGEERTAIKLIVESRK